MATWPNRVVRSRRAEDRGTTGEDWWGNQMRGRRFPAATSGQEPGFFGVELELVPCV